MAIATTYSTPMASRKSSRSGSANPPSSRTRTRAFGKAAHTRCRIRQRMPIAPRLAGALPGRSTAAQRYCSFSSLKLTKAKQRQIAPGIVVAVKEGQLLRAVGGIIGRIQVDRDELGAAMQPAAMAFDHTIGQRFAHPVKLFAVGRILETADRRLRGQVLAFNRIAPDQHLVHGVFGQPRRIVGVGITTGNTEDALPQQLLGSHGQLCLVAACLSSRPPAPPSVESAGQQPSRGSRRHRNFLAAGQTAQPPASGKYRETTNTVLCYSRSTESLLVWFKPA